MRERVGLDGEEVLPPASVATIADLVGWLAARGEGHAAALADPARLRAAVDGVFAPLDASLSDAREVALFPPVTGG